MKDNHESTGENSLYNQGNFEKLFSRVASMLKLDVRLDRHELSQLRRAYFLATLCNITFNGLGACHGKVQPESERTRIALEQTFMSARDRLYASRGWQRLPSLVQQRLEQTLLRVEIAKHNLAR